MTQSPGGGSIASFSSLEPAIVPPSAVDSLGAEAGHGEAPGRIVANNAQ
jgi:hypothetical protein